MKEKKQIIAKDFMGNRIYVGDDVLFSCLKYRELKIGTVVSITKKTFLINQSDTRPLGKYMARQHHHQVVLKPPPPCASCGYNWNSPTIHCLRGKSCSSENKYKEYVSKITFTHSD